MPKLFSILGVTVALGASGSVVWAQEALKEGVDYQVVAAVRSDAPKVIEFYAYGCSHCGTLEPKLKSWVEATASVGSVTRVPVTFGRTQWQHFAEAYYLGEVLGKGDAVHAALFEQARQRKRLDSEEALIAFFAPLGVDAEQVRGQLKSFAVQSRLKQGDYLVNKYHINAVPSFVVNDKYLTGGVLLSDPDKLGDALSVLLQKTD